MEQNKDLHTLRHSAQHILSQAVYDLYPGVKMAMGPATDDGFYGDFEFPEGVVISSEDLPKIEKRMKEIIKKGEEIRNTNLSVEEARLLFPNNQYKQEWLDEINERGESASVYWTGDRFVDLCAGPHVEKTSEIKAVKLMNVAGAYWRGDSNNKMLTRIYGTAFYSKEDLANYLHMLEEAKKRDHRKIGKEMDLFHFEPEFAAGSVFWHDKGYKIYRKMINYIRQRQEENGYTEIATPAVMDRVLWETSGHWEKYGAHNYSGETEDGRVFCIKPMNCPGGVLVFRQGIKSYRDLPMRIAEFGKVHRYETSGSLAGIMRVREFTQDDAHIYCTPEQLEAECIETLKLILDIYKDFGFENVKIYLSTRPEQRIGSDEIWDISEKSLMTALEKNGYEYEINEGDGAFYGPKLEFALKDALGREWQCGTIQVDMNLPERFDVSYIGEDGGKHRPVMLHRALFGSIERFLGILIEHFAGKLPLWLSPVHATIIPITDNQKDYGDKVYNKLKEVFGASLVVERDYAAESMQKRIRNAQLQRIPYMIVLGDNEVSNEKISVRTRDNKQVNDISLDDFIAAIEKGIKEKSLVLDL